MTDPPFTESHADLGAPHLHSISYSAVVRQFAGRRARSTATTSRQ